MPSAWVEVKTWVEVSRSAASRTVRGSPAACWMIAMSACDSSRKRLFPWYGRFYFFFILSFLKKIHCSSLFSSELGWRSSADGQLLLRQLRFSAFSHPISIRVNLLCQSERTGPCLEPLFISGGCVWPVAWGTLTKMCGTMNAVKYSQFMTAIPNPVSGT